MASLRTPRLRSRRLGWLGGGLLGLAGWAGCAPEGTYTLQISPRVLQGQAPFDTAPELRIYLNSPDHPAQILDLGRAQGPPLELPDLPPLPAGTLLGLLAEVPGGQPAKYNPSRLIAYGAHVLAEDIGYDDDPREIPLLMAERGHVGGLGFLDSPALHSALAMLPNGDLYLFGGAQSLGGPGSDQILALRDLNGGDWTFSHLNQVLLGPRVGLTATPVAGDGAPLILLAGGRFHAGQVDGNLDELLLFDPDSERFVWGTAYQDVRLSTPRSDHQALSISSGVLFFGGRAGQTGTEPASFDLFDPLSRTLLASGPLPTGQLGVAGAPFEDGAVLCGGADPIYDADEAPIVHDTCVHVDADGRTVPFPSLPVPLAHHAMAPLPSGGLLVTGGLVGPADLLDASVEASALAFVYEEGQWTEVEPMNVPRARHRLIPIPRHDVLVIGGLLESGWTERVGTGGQPCPEGYQTLNYRFRMASDRCSLPGTGADAPWSWQPGIGAVGLEGWSGDGGGFRYGLTTFGPDL